MTRSAPQHCDTTENVELSAQDSLHLQNEWTTFPQIEPKTNPAPLTPLKLIAPLLSLYDIFGLFLLMRVSVCVNRHPSPIVM
jgi:hypothetical protein